MAGPVPGILVVDGEPLTRDLLVRILGSEGFNVSTASEPLTAVQSAAQGADLVLLDPVLPGQCGYEVCAALKSDSRTTDIPVILLSSRDDTASRIAGFNAGCADYISKPFSAREVLARVRVHLRLRTANGCILRQQSAIFEELRHAQESILVRPEDCPEGSFAVAWRPLDVVGGDFYDVVPFSGGAVGYFVADVSGHGVAASFLTAGVKTLLRQYASALYTLEDTMRGMNVILRSILKDTRYVTACYARVSADRRTLTVISAGHLPLILVSNSEPRVVPIESDPLGVFGDLVLHKQEFEVCPGDRFFLYTDGLIENVGSTAGRAAGLELLGAACGRHHRDPLGQGVQAIVGELNPDGRALADDLLLLGVEVRA